MDEEKLNIEIRKFLKKVGIRSQREIETSIKQKFEKGLLDGNDRLDISLVLQIPAVKLNVHIKDKIELR